MKLNLGCGDNRAKGESWRNVDILFSVFPDEQRPERKQLLKEGNYQDHDITKPLPYGDGTIDGIVLSHTLEHFDMAQSRSIMQECHRVLRPEGVVRVIIPDVTMFHDKTVMEDFDWGEPNPWGTDRFLHEALFFNEHKQLLGRDSVYCLFYVVGFKTYMASIYRKSIMPELTVLDNRPKFSLFVEAKK